MRRFVAARLPAYMVPTFLVIIDKLPLMPNGKVDPKALPMPDGLRPDLEAVFEAPQTPLETTIAEIWQEALDVERVGLYDNFFDLGGHSLLAMQVIAALESELGVRFHPRDLIFQSLGQLVSTAKERAQVGASSENIGPVRRMWGAIKRAWG